MIDRINALRVKLTPPAVRKRLYQLGYALGGLAVAYGLIAQTEVSKWLALFLAALNLLAAGNTSADQPADDADHHVDLGDDLDDGYGGRTLS